MLCTASGTFRILAYSELCFFRNMPAYLIIFSITKAYSCIFGHYYGIFRLIQAYLAPCVTLVYSQPYHIVSPGVIKTGGLFKNLRNIGQACSESCHGAFFSHIQNLMQRVHTRKPGILRVLEYSELFHKYIPKDIQNPVIFTKIYKYSELWHI